MIYLVFLKEEIRYVPASKNREKLNQYNRSKMNSQANEVLSPIILPYLILGKISEFWASHTAVSNNMSMAKQKMKNRNL